MSLVKYTAKRNFEVTPEPKAVLKKNSATLSFVVQRHKASHLHYDLRLEMDGVLKSWAVPKGPSMNPGDKRLAMMVEDHPFSYKDFKGVIPEGYGAGIVEIWDNGKYTDIDSSGKDAENKLKDGLHSGSLKFILAGKKLRGEFALVKLKGKQENAWLLIKHKDEFAVSQPYDSEKETAKTSPINKWLATNKQPEKKIFYQPSKGSREKLVNFIKPMLAKETANAFEDKDWLFEIKWDGYRAISEIKDGSVLLYSRNGNSFVNDYPIVVKELKKIKHDAILDGEIVLLNEEGKSDFQKLQQYEDNTQYPLCYYVFDLLWLNGNSTYELPLIERKKLLKKLLPKNAVIKYSEHIIERGKELFAAAKQNDLEGIMAKKADSLYHPGVRTGDWLKIKYHKRQEVIIAGFTQPTGSRKYFGALVLALPDGDKLKYIGHTGSGFTDTDLKKIYGLLKPLIQKKSPFDKVVKTNAAVTWVKPTLIGEIKFTEWTTDNKMRHPIFVGLRDNKTVTEINMASIKKGKPQIQQPIAEEKPNSTIKSFGKVKVTTTNLNKIYFADKAITKGMVIDYYQQVADYILPYLKDRPQSLKRNPNGILDKGFYHKDAGDAAPAWVKSIEIYSDSAKKEIDYIICNNRQTLAYLNNLGCIELNPWSSRIKSLDKADYLIIDLDPAEKNTFEQVIKTALAFKVILDKAGADCYCKTSGATGLHIFLPMGKKYLYEQVKDFAHLLCTMVNEQLPEFTSLERNLQKRGNNKIYLDYLQNRRGQTIASVYSLRPNPGATVSMPLLWKEVKAGLKPSVFTIETVIPRIKKMGDVFSGVLGKGIDIKKCLYNLNETI